MQILMLNELEKSSSHQNTKDVCWWKRDRKDAYSIREAEKSCLLYPIPVLYLVMHADALSKPISPPMLTSLLPIAADNSSKGVGVKPMLVVMAPWWWRYCTSSCQKTKKKIVSQISILLYLYNGLFHLWEITDKEIIMVFQPCTSSIH